MGPRQQVTFTSPRFPVCVPSDATVLEGVRAVYITVTGDLIADDHDGNTDTPFPVVVGQQLNIQPSKIKAASTASCILYY